MHIHTYTHICIYKLGYIYTLLDDLRETLSRVLFIIYITIYDTVTQDLKKNKEDRINQSLLVDGFFFRLFFLPTSPRFVVNYF